MSYSFGNAQHIGARQSQQDAFGFTNPFDADFARHGGLLAVLADGMGGLSHGAEASRAALSAFLAAYKAKTPEETVDAALERAMETANRAVCNLAARHNAVGEAGTTLVAAVLHSGGLEWISAGDSGLFLFRGGRFFAINTPHVYAQDLDARASAGAITSEAALADPQRDALTSFLGLEQIPHIDRSVRPFPVTAADDIVLASDGLFKTLSSEEMARAMQGTVQQRCDALVRAVVERATGQQDNVTVVALAARSEVSLPATVRLAPAPSRAPRWPWAAAAGLAVSALVAYSLIRCCAPPDMPKPPAAPKELAR
jgi:protein phosphatase